MKRYIQASKTNYYVVHYGWDEGGPESGPIFKSDNIIVKARNAKAAEARVVNKIDGIEGCWAEPATDKDLEAFQNDMKEFNEEYEHLLELGIIDPLDDEMLEAINGPDFKKMTISELKKYYNDVVETYEGSRHRDFKDWLNYLRSTNQR